MKVKLYLSTTTNSHTTVFYRHIRFWSKPLGALLKALTRKSTCNYIFSLRKIFLVFEIHVRQQAEGIFICVSFCVTPPDETKNDTDWNFGTHTHSPTPNLKGFFFGFFEKVTLRAASLQKLPRHMDSVYLPDRLFKTH